MLRLQYTQIRRADQHAGTLRGYMHAHGKEVPTLQLEMLGDYFAPQLLLVFGPLGDLLDWGMNTIIQVEDKS